MRFETWDVRGLHRACSLKTAARKSENCKLDVMGVEEVRWDEGGSQPAHDYKFFYGNHHLGTGFRIHTGTILAAKRVEFISDSVSYITVRGRWCDIIVLNSQAPSDDTKDGFTRTKSCIGSVPEVEGSNAKIGREDILKRSGMRVYMKLVMIMGLE
jgi:hypothetical protein